MKFHAKNKRQSTVLIILHFLVIVDVVVVVSFVYWATIASDAIDIFFLSIHSRSRKFHKNLQQHNRGEVFNWDAVFISTLCSLGSMCAVYYQRFWLSIFSSSFQIESRNWEGFLWILKEWEIFAFCWANYIDYWIKSCVILLFGLWAVVRSEQEPEVRSSNRWKMKNMKWEDFSAITRFNELSLLQFRV